MNRGTESFARQAFWGVLLVAASLVATKLSALLAQFALGWLLTSNDYKVWGMLLSFRMLVDGLRHGGMVPVMQQQGVSALREARVYLQYGLGFNMLAAVILLAFTPAAEWYFQTEGLRWLVVLMAVSLLLQTFGALHRTRLSIELRFSTIAKSTAVAAFTAYASMVALAALGMGPYSFVIPLSISVLIEWAFFRQAAGPIDRGANLTRPAFAKIFRISRWVMVSAGLAAITTMGDYLIIGRLAPDLLGEYLFGFQLTVAFSTVVVAGFQQVMLPTFSRLQADRRRLAQAFTRSITLTALLSAPCFAAIALFAPTIIHLLWAGKWDNAIPVVQVMSLVLILRLLNPLAISTLQVMGRWDVYAKTLVVDAASIVAAAVIGCWAGDLPTLAVAVGIGRCLAVPILIAAACTALEIPGWALVMKLSSRIALPVVSVLTVWVTTGFPGIGRREDIAVAMLVVFVTTLLMARFFRMELRQILGMLFGPRGHADAVPDPPWNRPSSN